MKTRQGYLRLFLFTRFSSVSRSRRNFSSFLLLLLYVPSPALVSSLFIALLGSRSAHDLSSAKTLGNNDGEQSVSRDTVENKDRVRRMRDAIGRDVVILCGHLRENTAVHFVARMPMIITLPRCCPNISEVIEDHVFQD